MIYRFDQSLGISSRLTHTALRNITIAAAPKDRTDNSLVMGVFNATAEDVDEPIDLEVALPSTWPKKFQEFFGFLEGAHSYVPPTDPATGRRTPANRKAT